MPDLRIAAITPLTERIAEFRLEALEGDSLPAFTDGAHIRVEIGNGQTRAYSLIRRAAQAAPVREYCIAVQLEAESTGGSAFMHGLKPGGRITVSIPKNDFPVDTGAPALLLAGGIGITPMISMATALAEAGQAFDFHYAGRTAAAMAYREALAGQFGDSLRIHCDDDPATALDLGALAGNLGAGRHLYVCGPRGMIEAAKSAAEAAGVPAERIHFELFTTAQPGAGDSAFEVEIASSGEVFTVAPGQSIIEALEAGGVDVMYDCQRGDCGICQTGVISGVPDHRDVVLSEAERAGGKVMQICVSRAKSDRLVLDI